MLTQRELTKIAKLMGLLPSGHNNKGEKYVRVDDMISILECFTAEARKKEREKKKEGEEKRDL